MRELSRNSKKRTMRDGWIGLVCWVVAVVVRLFLFFFLVTLGFLLWLLLFGYFVLGRFVSKMVLNSLRPLSCHQKVSFYYSFYIDAINHCKFLFLLLMLLSKCLKSYGLETEKENEMNVGQVFTYGLYFCGNLSQFWV